VSDTDEHARPRLGKGRKNLYFSQYGIDIATYFWINTPSPFLGRGRRICRITKGKAMSQNGDGKKTKGGSGGMNGNGASTKGNNECAFLPPSASPPPAAEVPDGIPSDGDFRSTDMSATGDACLIVGDRAREVQRAKLDAQEAAQQRERLRAEIRAGMAAEPEIDEVPAVQLLMQPYWNLVAPEITRPGEEWTFKKVDGASAALVGAFPILGNKDETNLLRTASLALFGATEQVSVERFANIIAIVRDLQERADEENASRQRTAEEEASKMRGEALKRLLQNAEDSILPAPPPTDSDPAGQSGEWDTKEVFGSDGGRSLVDMGGEHRVDGGAQMGRGARAGRPTPIPRTDQEYTVWSGPAPAPVTKARERTSRRAIYVLVTLVLMAVGLSLAFLFSDREVMRAEIQAQSVRNDSQDDYISVVDDKVSRVITALSAEKGRVIVLQRERDEFQGLATSFRDAMEAKKREEGQTRMRYEVRFDQLQDEIRALRSQLDVKIEPTSPPQN
jgi:hypothetical protein